MKHEPVAEPAYGSALAASVQYAFQVLHREYMWFNFCMWAIDRKWQG